MTGSGSPSLFIPLVDRLIRPLDPDEPVRNAFGERLDREWQGAELGFLRDEEALREAVREVRSRGWALGVHWPLVRKHPQQPRWFDPDPRARQEALAEGIQAVRQAAQLRAEYVLLHFPWPAMLDDGGTPGTNGAVGAAALGWYFSTDPVLMRAWPLEAVLTWSREVVQRLFEAAGQAGIEVILEIDGPSRLFYEPLSGTPDLFLWLLEDVPGVGLCLDTGRAALLARTHGRQPLEMVRRWYPVITHVHLHAANWERRLNHVPVLPSQRPDAGWSPSVVMARELASVRPGIRIVLEHDPAKVSAEELEVTHDWVRSL